MPDLNSVPASPHTLASSRRISSHQMPPPPVPSSPSLNILPSNQPAVQGQTTASQISPIPIPIPTANAAAAMMHTPPGVDSAVGPGPGPLRHPRPLTAADLHLQLEKEQEAVVNRLTRELSLLRAAQNASVVSNASSTSASGTGAASEAHHDIHLLSGTGGFSIPSTSRRHHRTSSNTSTPSQTTAGAQASLLSTSVEARRPNPASLSRQNSTASRRSQTSSPAPQHLILGDSSLSYFQQQRIPLGTGPTSSSVAPTPGSAGLTEQMSPGLLPGTTRYEETVFYRAELDTAKRENEVLKRRIRELERMVRERRASNASRPRSESASTTASISVSGGGGGGGTGIAGPRDIARERAPERERGMTSVSIAGSVGVGIPDDELRVGESAASAGLGGQEEKR